MFAIGDFARFGRVSVRSLRHYDSLGLLVPARVDAGGRRYYEAAQLARLNRIVALKELGFTLRQVADLLDDKIDVAELEGMLRLRRAEIQARVADDLDRLARVEARLGLIRREGTPPGEEIRVKRVPAQRVVELSATAAGWEPDAIAPVVVPLFGQVYERLAAAGGTPGTMIAYYEPDPGGVRVHAAVTADAEVPGLTAAVLDGAEVAAFVHRGPMDRADAVWQQIAGWIDAHGYRVAGTHAR
ncbi:MerR family transcriptional regulator [Actinomadura sp. CNU-125]|uniref:MerR family transcriptional regulator n=1 Tax=Actinomadura sp. CNU-125 TaxID=1904961 RepID=UPI0021CC6A5A|nr:MerR family transcriptional regulator [Actinomadura sp. CNU-125]